MNSNATSGTTGYVFVQGKVMHETEKAILFDDGGKEPKWIPKSVCEIYSDGITVTQYIAREKGFI